MTDNEINNKFDDIIKPKIINQITRERRPAAKFPELRYLWGITLLGSFILTVVASVISTLIHGV
jgi:hypothetical protein